MRALRAVDRRALRLLAGIGGPLAATGLGLIIGSGRTTAAALVYLLAVLGVATLAGLGAGILASTLSFLGLNFFFTPPRHTLSVSKADDLIALVVFLSVGMVVSTLVALERTQRARAERREYETRSLYSISNRLLGEDMDEAFAELARLMRRLFDLSRCEIRTRGDDGTVELRAADGEDPRGAVRVEIPLATAERNLGVLLLVPRSAFGEAERQVATIFARQTASALERGVLEREAREVRLAAEANRVRRALLSAVSHDFRTPLASIKAAITALMPGGAAPLPSSQDTSELLGTALEETERLERLVSNLLDLTRIRSGALAPDRSSVPVEDILDDALAGLRSALGAHEVSVRIRPDVPRLYVDPVQVGQVLHNVLQNAAKFSPIGSEIRVTAAPWKGAVEIRVADRGLGIDASERAAVFEEFYRAGDGRAAGTGLGLAVAKALVQAQDGEIWIEGTPGGGTTVAIRLPGREAR